jgi:hypothetical protein
MLKDVDHVIDWSVLQVEPEGEFQPEPQCILQKCSCSGTEQSSKLKCSGSTLGLMKLHGRWLIRCGLCILHCLLVEAKYMFWHICVLVYVLVYILYMYILLCFVYVYMYMDVNTTMSYVIKLQ